MSPTRKLTGGALPAVIVIAIVHAGGCGTEAVAVDACRQIESARCEAAAHCGDRFGISDVESCQRFYDAQCLHGFAADDAPGTPDINECVATIRAAGECADEDGADATCNTIDAEVSESMTACDVVAHPEKASTCAFLNPSPEESKEADDESSAGAAGTGSEDASSASGSAGTSGQGGDAD